MLEGLTGRRLGEFVLREHLGEGGFGMVFRADQPILQRDAVVKVSQVRGQGDDGAVQRFLGEARLASRLDHPFAAHVYAFGAEPDGLLWIAMELVRGTPLDAMIAEHGALPLERAIPFLRRLCEVVHTAHEQGIVHRDLKPANVMVVARAGNVFPKLLDLGIATDARAAAGGVLGGAGKRETQAGTPHYMAPEQWIDAARAGPPADIYALGALTYEVLTGAPPFTGRSVLEIAAQHARKPPPALPASFPPALSAAIARAMAKRAGERFGSAIELGEALRETSGISLESVNLPQIDELTRDEVLVHAPQPIAEAVAALDAARAAGPARDALWRAARVCAQYVALVGLACRARAGSGRHGDPPAVTAALAALRDTGLDAAAWWKLARELVRPFAAMPDAYPVPELVGVFFEGKAELRTAMDALLASAANEPPATAPAEAVRDFLIGAVPALAAVLRALRPLDGYALAAPDVDGGAGHTRWTGVRRPVRATVGAGAALGPGVWLVDASGAPVLALDAVAEATAPAPGAPAELFWIDGPGRGGAARMVALPGRFEHHRADGWTRLGLDAGAAGDAAAVRADVAPYRGLSTFTESDADLYFGREREVEGFVNRLRVMPLIAVVGPSGAGKSSFVRAGVLPTLGAAWRAIVVRPGPAPLANLAARLAADGVTVTRAELLADPGGLGARLRARATALGASLLVVVDQFEELFTLCLDPVEQAAYADALVRAAGDPRPDADVRVVVTLRDDFLVRAAQLAALRERLGASLQILTTPVADDLRRILVEPARRAGFEFEDAELPAEMVREVEAQPAALALLSFTASQLWQFRDRQFRQLPRKAYRALGGVGGALAQHAEATLDAMPEADRAIVRELFRHLVTADGTRAVLSRAELVQVAGSVQRAEAVLEALINARLLVAMERADGAGENIEVVHEALLSAWPRLVRWRQEDAEGARLRDQLRVAARQWADRDRPRGLLWRGEALAEYRLWRARYPGRLTDVEEAFGGASVADAARGRRLRRIALGTVLAGLTVALIVFARLRADAEDSRERAVESGERALASEAEVKHRLIEGLIEQGRRALVEGRATEAALFLEAAIGTGADTPAIRFMLARALEPLDAELATLRGHTGQLFDIRLSPDRTRVATASDDGTVRLWDAATGAAVRTIDAAPRGGLVFARWSADGASVWAGGGDGQLVRWEAATGARAAAIGEPGDPFNSLELAADARRAVAGTMGGVVRLYDLDAGTAVTLGVAAPGVFSHGELSPSGDAVAIATIDPATGAGGAAIWPVRGGAPIALAGHHAGVQTAVFDPAGARVATAGLDNTARIFDARTGKPGHVLRGHDQRVTDLAWSPDGALIATASADLTVKVWDAATGETVRGLRGHGAQVNRVRFTRDGLLISAATDGTAKVWDARRGHLLATFGHSGYVFQIDVDAAATRLATASWDGTAKLWRLDRRAVRTLPGEPASDPLVPPPLLAPDGIHAIRHRDGGGEVWNLDTGAVAIVAAAPGAAVTARAIDPAGTIAAFGDAGGGVRVVAIAGGRGGGNGAGVGDAPVAAWQTERGAVTAIAIAPGGEPIYTAGVDGTITAWSRSGTRRAQTAAPIGGTVNRIDLNADASALLVLAFTAEGMPTGVVLDAALARATPIDGHIAGVFTPDGARVVSALAGAGLAVSSKAGAVEHRLALGTNAVALAWSPRGDRLFIGEVDGAVEVWEPGATWRRVARIAAHDAAVLATTVSADGHFVATTGGDATVKIWDAVTLRQLHGIKVPPETLWAGIDPTGRWLVMTDDVRLDVAAAGRTPIAPAELAALIRCRVPFRLDGQIIVPATPACP